MITEYKDGTFDDCKLRYTMIILISIKKYDYYDKQNGDEHTMFTMAMMKQISRDVNEY